MGKPRNGTEGTPDEKAQAQPFLSLCVDWLAFGKNCVQGLNDIQDEIIRTFKSHREVRRLRFDYVGVDLACNGMLSSRGSHVKVELPGQALQYVRYALGITDQKLIEWFLKRGFKATRLDAALDCADKAFNPLVAFRYRQRDNVRCESSKLDFDAPGIDPNNPKILPKNGEEMTTIFGSKKSDRWMRIYDKLREMLKKTGEIPTDNEGNELDHLTRIELQCRRKVSNCMAEDICREGVGFIRKAIAGYVSFLDPRDKRQRRRRQIAKWWLRIVGDERRELSLPHVVATPDRSIRWIKKQAAATLRAMRDFAPEKWKDLLENTIAEYDLSKKKERVWSAWAKARKERKALMEELTQIEREDDALWRIQKQIDAQSKTVSDFETDGDDEVSAVGA